MTTLIIIIICCTITATIMEIGWGCDKHIPHNSGCLAIMLGMRFSHKWLSVLYQTLIIVASMLTMIMVAYWFGCKDLTVITYFLAVIVTVLSALIPIIMMVIINLLMLLAIGIVCWFKYCC